VLLTTHSASADVGTPAPSDLRVEFVAIAEALGASLATLDARLANAPGPHCRFMVSGETA
jgi:hypothetical protein